METKEKIIDEINMCMNMSLGTTLTAIDFLNSVKENKWLQKIGIESFVDCVGEYIEEIKRLMVKL